MAVSKVKYKKKIQTGKLYLNGNTYILPVGCEIIEYLPPDNETDWFGELLFEYKNRSKIKEYTLEVNPYSENSESILLKKILKSENIMPLCFYKLRTCVHINNIDDTCIVTSTKEFNQILVDKNKRIFISALNYKAQTLEEIVDKISKNFSDVDKDTLKKDTEDFFETLIKQDFIIKGDSKVDVYNKDSDFEQIESFRVYITEKCNANCPTCFNAESRTSKEMSIEDFEKLCIYLSSNGIKHLKIMGGEPTIHQDFEKIVKIAQSQFREITIFTNGINDRIKNIKLREKDCICYNFLFSDVFSKEKFCFEIGGIRALQIQILKDKDEIDLAERIIKIVNFEKEKIGVFLSLDCTSNIIKDKNVIYSRQIEKSRY